MRIAGPTIPMPLPGQSPASRRAPDVEPAAVPRARPAATGEEQAPRSERTAYRRVERVEVMAPDAGPVPQDEADRRAPPALRAFREVAGLGEAEFMGVGGRLDLYV